MTTVYPPVVEQPDAEAFVWSVISSIPGVTSFSYAVVFDWIGFNATYGMQIDARASTKQAARDRAEAVRQAVLNLPGEPWADGVCTYAEPVEGPFWFPDGDDASPRYTARYEIHVHPVPSGIARHDGARDTGRIVGKE